MPLEAAGERNLLFLYFPSMQAKRATAYNRQQQMKRLKQVLNLDTELQTSEHSQAEVLS